VVSLTPETVLKILRAISDQDCLDLGLSPEYARPEWMVMTILPVPPMTVRPSISIDGMSRGEDDLTFKLADIVKANLALRRFENEGVNALVLTEFEDLLQFHVATYMDNDIAGIPQALQKSGRPVSVYE
jgi:DNA-directed RNA polymerase II subunit RPB1